MNPDRLKKIQELDSQWDSIPASNNVQSATKNRAMELRARAERQRQSQESENPGLFSKIADTVVDATGLRGVTDTFGSEIAKIGKSDTEKSILSQEQPSLKTTAGSALQGASLFVPVGSVAKGIGTGAKALGLGAKAASTIGNVASGALAGATYDIGEKLQTGETSGIGTALGTAIPLAGPAAKLAGKAGGKIATEVLGKTTGVGADVLREGFEASMKGGGAKDAFVEAMRSGNNPEQLVESAKNSLSDIIKQRSDEYRTNLSKIKTKTQQIDHTPIIQKFNDKLAKFGVVENNGVADFSRAPGLGRYENDLKKLSQTLANWGTREGDNTIAGIDTLKQVIDDFKIGSADSKKFDSFVTELRKEAKNIIEENLTKSGDTETLNTYKKMLSDYESKTGTIKEILKGLSLGDTPSIDTAFKKLTSSLRTNQEFRKQLVTELDDATGGFLTSKIAGQQLSKWAPRGLVGPISAVGGLGAMSTGIGLAKLLPAAFAISPRAVGEIINALGIGARKSKQIIEFLGNATGKFVAPGDALLESKTGSKIKDTLSTMNKSEGGFVKLSDSGKIVKAIDEPTKREINNVLKYLNQDTKVFIENKALEGDLSRLAEKFEINLDQTIPKIKADLSRLLEKTKTQ